MAADKTVTKAGEIVAGVRDLLTVARDTASSSEAAAEAAQLTVQTARELVTHARETVEVARAAREADDLARLERQLREIGELAERAFNKAAIEAGARPLAGWRCSSSITSPLRSWGSAWTCRNATLSPDRARPPA
jgi:hypothetical protein